MSERESRWAREITVGVTTNLIASGVIFLIAKALHLLPSSTSGKVLVFATSSGAVALIAFIVGRAIVGRKYRIGAGLMGLGMFLLGVAVLVLALFTQVDDSNRIWNAVGSLGMITIGAASMAAAWKSPPDSSLTKTHPPTPPKA